MKRLDIIWDDVYNESAIKCERRKMSTIVELMLAIREGYTIFYHKDTNQFDHYPFSELEKPGISPGKLIPLNDPNNLRLPSYKEVDHEEIMRFYVREQVEDKEIRKQLFDILRRNEYMDAFIAKLHELNLS